MCKIIIALSTAAASWWERKQESLVELGFQLTILKHCIVFISLYFWFATTGNHYLSKS